MKNLCTFGGAMIFGYLGWWVGDASGLGFFGAFIASGVASLVGVYLGWKFARRFE